MYRSTLIEKTCPICYTGTMKSTHQSTNTGYRHECTRCHNTEFYTVEYPVARLLHNNREVEHG